MNKGRLNIASGYSIKSGGYAHWFLTNLSLLTVTQAVGKTVTVTGTPSFASNGFCYCDRLSLVEMYYEYLTFSGTATGTKYAVSTNGVILTFGGANYFPGGTSGTVATGGQYV